MVKNSKDVFIIGSKGIPANYGGFETFVDKLTFYSTNKKINYHVSCAIYDKFEYKNLDSEFKYHNAHCFRINVPNLGAAKAIIYDLKSLRYCVHYIKKNNIKNPIIYVLACRIGPFINYYKKKLKKLNGFLYVNPDGHEWLRSKWSKPVKKYWQISEKLMVKHADLLICDSKNIEKYIIDNYKKYNPKTTFIAYGAETSLSSLKDNEKSVMEWYDKWNLSFKNYYLIVGRFVPENNFETIIKEFMMSKTKKDLAIITTADDKFLKDLEDRLHFSSDKRIKFVGTVYNQELLKKIRENAYGYIHGHEVGGTNPSLLEALGSTKLNLLLGVCFNKEVGSDAAFYWNKNEANLSKLIEKCDKLSDKDIDTIGKKAKKRISDQYNWNFICTRYDEEFFRTDIN